MTKILSIMIAMLMSISLSSFASTTTDTVSHNKSEKQLGQRPVQVSVPTNLVVKQTITFDDGKTIVVYYEKNGNDCKLFSKTDINKYGVADLSRIKSTNFEKTDHVEGKCYVSKTVSALIAMVRGMLK